MDTLRAQFDQVAVQINAIVQKLENKKLLTSEDLSDTVGSLQAILQEQRRYIDMLQQLGCDASVCAEADSLDALSELFEGQREQQETRDRVLELVERFLAIRSHAPECQAELERFQHQLASLDENELLKREQAGALEPYRRFIDYVKSGCPNYEAASELAGTFGSELVFALTWKKFTLPPVPEVGAEAEAAVSQPDPAPAPACPAAPPADEPTWEVDATASAGPEIVSEPPVERQKPLQASVPELTAVEPAQTTAEEPREELPAQAPQRSEAPATLVPDERSACSTCSTDTVLVSTLPIPLRDASAKSFLNESRRLSMAAHVILPVLTYFGVLDFDLIVRFTDIMGFEKVWSDRETMCAQMEQGFRDLTKNHLIAEYKLPDRAPLYCLTDYSYSCMHKANIAKNAKAIFGMSIGSHRIAGTQEVSRDALLAAYRMNDVIVQYLEFLKKESENLGLTAETLNKVIGTFRWKGDHYMMRPPLGESEAACPIFCAPDRYPGNGPALFLTDTPPEGPFEEGQPVFFSDGTVLCRWQDGWVTLGTAPDQQTEIPASGKPEVHTDLEQRRSSGADSETAGDALSASVVEPAPLVGSDPAPSGDAASEEPADTVSVGAEHEVSPDLELFVTADTGEIPDAVVGPVSDDTLDMITDAQAYAGVLLERGEQPRMEELLGLAVRLISEDRMAEAAALAETLAKAPNAKKASVSFYEIFRQSIRLPGSIYSHSSDVINALQKRLDDADPMLRSLEQVMVKSSLLWAMAFPSNAYDHNLYNSVTMVIGADESAIVRQLLSLLGSTLKELSFQNDGLGFSVGVLNNLAGDEVKEKQLRRLRAAAATLKRAPTSTIGLRGLETFLKQIVGPTSKIGTALAVVEADSRERADEVQAILAEEFTADQNRLDDALEDYIDRRWTELRHIDSKVMIKRLQNDSAARKTCKKALTDRIEVISQWLRIVDVEQQSNIQQYHEQYAQICSQIKNLLHKLIAAEDNSSLYASAGRNILCYTARKMLDRLEDASETERNFYLPLSLTPELILGENGENLIISELYDFPGMEPWTFLLRAIAAGPEDPEEILAQIGNYESDRWYRNYGTEARLRAQQGLEQLNRVQGVQNAEAAAEEDVQVFQSETRLKRAYDKIAEDRMETAFLALSLAKKAYFQGRDFASFRIFLARLKDLLERDVEARTARYEAELQTLIQDSRYADAPILDAIRNALDNQNLASVQVYINQLQSGIREISDSERTIEPEANFLMQFLECEEGYYEMCQRHRSENLSRWGEAALNRLGTRYQHWRSSNEQKSGIVWLSNWIQRRGDKYTGAKVRDLLLGLGFRVTSVEQDTSMIPPRAAYELYKVHAEKTPTNRKDYPHPIYKFGTDLSDPFYVVCLFGCKSESTLIHVMTSELQLNGPTIVLMDGSLPAAGRRIVAEKFKADTSGQSPFLLIDRVLLLYLASLDGGDRQNALLRCTLPYTFEVLYGNGIGAVPEEMFIGRIGEMNALRNEQGPDLVYGGRQLGKTALLNRVSKTIHDPENRAYSFCVDVKDAGSGALLEQSNRKLCKLKLLDGPCASLEELCDTLQAAYESGRIHRLCIFVDEVDQLFEEFQESRFEALRPFIVLRDTTKRHVKFVFAGTHNVAATESADDNNSNLVHMGTPLCIGPLSSGDAIKLIRIPMSYLGFEIGDTQIELILSNTNSYPGLIHMFCSALIQSVCRDYRLYYAGGGARENPPYRISDEQMRAVFKEKDIRKEIGTRVMATIKLNQKYRIVSWLLAHMIYEGQENEQNRLYGYTPRELLDYNEREFQIPLLNALTEKDLGALLNEMARMGILWENRENNQFRFCQQDFLSYIGSSDYVLEALLKESEEGD